MPQIELRFVLASKVTVFLSLGVLLASCGAARVCTPDACAEGTICDLDGTCRVLSERRDAAFSTATRLRPTRFEATRGDRSESAEGQYDEVVLGGSMDGAVYLGFELPRGRIVSAVLTLSTAEEAAPAAEQLVRVFALRGLDEGVSRRNEPGRGPATTGLRLRPARTFHIDVTDLARDARDDGDTLLLGVDAQERAERPWRIASPSALDAARRPRLHVRYTSTS